MAAAAERNSEHPYGKAIVERAAGLELPAVTSFIALAGLGVRAVAGGKIVQVSAYANGAGSLAPGESALGVIVDGLPLGSIVVADALRPEAREAVQLLRGSNIAFAMITGDRRSTAEAIALEAGIERLMAEVLPGDKSAEVERLQKTGVKVAMVGDGINDAPALALPSQNQTRELRERPINIDSETICRLDERMAYSAECPEATVDAENTVNALLECKALGANAGRLSKYQAVCLVTSSNTAPCLIRSNSA